jgi:MFS family permease
MQSQPPKPAQLAAFWLSVQMLWGALLGISLQMRASQLAPHTAIASYGVLASTGAAIAAVTQIGIGLLSDRRRLAGSRRVEFYASGAAAGAGALFWFYVAPSFTQLLLAFAVLQVAMNVAIGPYQAIIPDFVEENRLGTASSWMAGMGSVGVAAGGLLAGLVSNTRVVAAAIGLALLAGSAVTIAHVRTLRLLPALPDRLRLSRAFADLFISRALIYLGFYTLVGYLFFYVRHTVAGGGRTTGLLIVLVNVCTVIGAVIAARPADRFDRRGIAAGGGAAFIAALAAFLLAHSLGGVAAGAAGAGVAWGIFLSADWALGCQFLPRSSLATAMGIWNLALLLPQMAAPQLATALLAVTGMLHNSGAPRIAFVLAGAEVAAGVLWIWRLPASSARIDEPYRGNNR